MSETVVTVVAEASSEPRGYKSEEAHRLHALAAAALEEEAVAENVLRRRAFSKEAEAKAVIEDVMRFHLAGGSLSLTEWTLLSPAARTAHCEAGIRVSKERARWTADALETTRRTVT